MTMKVIMSEWGEGDDEEIDEECNDEGEDENYAIPDSSYHHVLLYIVDNSKQRSRSIQKLVPLSCLFWNIGSGCTVSAGNYPDYNLLYENMEFATVILIFRYQQVSCP